MIGAALLAGCQSAGEAPPPEVRADAWRVIERVGEARYLAPGASSWAAALPATVLPGGSQVETGAGGRLILARAADHVSASPGSQFSLPDAAAGVALEQTAGRLRYRLAEPRPFAVTTPALAIAVQDGGSQGGGSQGGGIRGGGIRGGGFQGGVFDVTVGADATEVAVEHGRLRVATPDGEREIELQDGQSAYASAPEALAFRRASGQPLEPVERLVLPALQPKSDVAEASPLGSRPAVARADDQASTSAAASVESAVPAATAAAGATAPVTPAARAMAPATTEATSGTLGSVPAAPGQPSAAPGQPSAAPGPTIAPAPIAAPTEAPAPIAARPRRRPRSPTRPRHRPRSPPRRKRRHRPWTRPRTRPARTRACCSTA